ncbi:MAG: extracellular solute-binding protein [Planctomycetota bacterium]
MKAKVFLMVWLALGGASVSQAGEPPTLHLMHMQAAPSAKQAVQEAVDRFTAETGVAVRVEAHKNDPYKQKIATVLGSDEAPDVFHSWGGGILARYVGEGAVEPLPDDFPVDGISPAVLDFCTVNEKLYAVPTDVSLVVFWYQKSIFDEHGLDEPETFDDLLGLCRTLRSKGVTPIALGNLQQWPGAFYFDYLMIRLGGAEEYLRKTNRAGEPVQTRAALTAAERIRALVESGALIEGFNGLKYDDARSAFFRKDAAMTLMGTWLLSYALSEQEKGDSEVDVAGFGIFPFPAVGKTDESGALLGGTNAAYAVSANSDHKALAFDLVRYLTDSRAAEGWAKAGRIPARKVDVPGGAGVRARTTALLAEAPSLQLYFDQALSPQAAEQHKAFTQSLFVGEPHWLIRIVVIAAAVLAVLVIGVILRTVFRSGEGTGG